MVRKKLLGSLFAGLLLVGSLSAAEVIIRVAPPRPLVEQRVVSPCRGYVWIGGYHRWEGRSYVGVPGRWELPPRPHARWVAHTYVRRGDGWAYREGHWR